MEKEKEGKKIINVDLEDEGEDEEQEEEDTNESASENSNVQSENGTANKNPKKNVKITRALKDIIASNNGKFMSNFDPELSNRERRKLTRKINAEGKKNGSTTDENGVQNTTEKDVCDCLNEDCPGCHFPCLKCRSCKCGVECRVNRKWTYDSIKNESELAIVKSSKHSEG